MNKYPDTNYFDGDGVVVHPNDWNHTDSCLRLAACSVDVVGESSAAVACSSVDLSDWLFVAVVW